jgi:hypothetical protein
MKRLLIVPALAVLLSGCGIAAKVNARHDMEASKVAYKECLAQHGQNVAACDVLHRAYEADLSVYQATAAAPRPGPVYSNQEPALAPDFGAGLLLTVYSRNNTSAPLLWGYVTALFYLRALITRLAMVKC